MALSPMMSHYLQIKDKYKDCIIFYRLGDFYEMFFDDAVKASEMLELTLTGRDCGLEERAPMCGIPYHAADEYIAKLVAMGEKVAICEQLSEPTANSKTLVERDVIKIITAGTVTNTDYIDEKTNNFLASVYLAENCASIAWSDITTGDFFAKNFDGNDFLSSVFDELIKINPVEIIGNTNAENILNSSPIITQKVLPKVRYIADSEFAISSATQTLCTQLKVFSLSPFGIKENSPCICAAGALISYFKSTQKIALVNITDIKIEKDNEIMMLDYNAVRNLELVRTIRDNKKYGTLLWVLDRTVTNMGARKLQNWILSPLYNVNAINNRLDAVEFFYKDNLIRSSLRDLLKGVKDIKRLTGKISNGNLLPKDCIALINSLELLPNVKFQLLGSNSKYICDISNNIKEFSEIIDLLRKAICDDDLQNVSGKNSVIKYIKEGYSKELDELRNLSSNGRSVIGEIQNRERENTGIKNLKIGYNKVFGYYIEVTNSFKEKVPYNYIRKQTLANCERYITEELKELEEKIISSEEKAIQLELRLYSEVKAFLVKYVSDLQKTSDSVADLDVLLSFATVAKENGYVRPTLNDKSLKIDITEGRHPVVEKVLKQRFISNDCYLDGDENVTMIITGPNMAGKSTYMRQVALITIMAHIGSFVPASEANISLTDRVFTRIGASDNLIFNQSTFMVEMGEMASIIKNATDKSLLILDEIGRGTSTFDGLSIAWAVVEYVTQDLKAKTLFATHYHELTELEGLIKGVKNYKITVKELQNNIVFLRKIMRGGTNRSFGIEVAELAGVDKKVTERAKQILKKLESKDITKTNTETFNVAENRKEKSEVEKILADIDVNKISPMQAFNIICDLVEKVKPNE